MRVEKEIECLERVSSDIYTLVGLCFIMAGD